MIPATLKHMLRDEEAALTAASIEVKRYEQGLAHARTDEGYRWRRVADLKAAIAALKGLNDGQ